MDGLPADAKLRRLIRRGARSEIDPHVVRLVAHKADWGSYHEIMDNWTLVDLVAALRVSDITDRLEELNAPKHTR
jgi:hypothetical protein